MINNLILKGHDVVIRPLFFIEADEIHEAKLKGVKPPYHAVLKRSHVNGIACDTPDRLEEAVSGFNLPDYVPALTITKLLAGMAIDATFGFLKGFNFPKTPALKKASAGRKYIAAPGVSDNVAYLVNAGLCSYLDLRDRLTYEEGFKLITVSMVAAENEAAALVSRN